MALTAEERTIIKDALRAARQDTDLKDLAPRKDRSAITTDAHFDALMASFTGSDEEKAAAEKYVNAIKRTGTAPAEAISIFISQVSTGGVGRDAHRELAAVLLRFIAPTSAIQAIADIVENNAEPVNLRKICLRALLEIKKKNIA